MDRKNIQIRYELFLDIVKYFLLDRYDLEPGIISGLQEKIDKLERHELYTKSKMAKTEADREKARQEYLDRVGMNESFRW